MTLRVNFEGQSIQLLSLQASPNYSCIASTQLNIWWIVL